MEKARHRNNAAEWLMFAGLFPLIIALRWMDWMRRAIARGRR